MAKLIFAVETKAGTVTRTTEGREYSHAVIVNEWPVTWCGRYDLAVKAQRQYGGEIVEAVQLEKQPQDPHKGIKIYNAELLKATGGAFYVTLLIDTDEKAYIKHTGEWSDGMGKVMKKGKEIKGYLDRLAVVYSFNKFKGVL